MANNPKKAAPTSAADENANRFLIVDDGSDLEKVISTGRNYVTIPVGHAIAGTFLEMLQDKDLQGNPRKRPVLEVFGETVVLPGHTQLEIAFSKIPVGTGVKVACVEKVQLAGGKTAWNYRVSVQQLPF